VTRETVAVPWSKVAFGLAVLSAGVLFWLDRLGHLEAADWIGWWPLVLIVIGAASLLERAWGSAVFLIATGTLFLLPSVTAYPISPWRVFDLLPLLVSAAGAGLLAQAIAPARKEFAGDRGRSVRMLALMSGNIRTNSSRSFLGGDAIAVMGGCEIDLRDAEIDGDEAVIDILAFWGGIDIRIPPHWRVVRRVVPLLGAFDDKTTRTAGAAKRLVIRGTAIMGGVEVRN
jgi:predicted membrane protein